MSFVDLAIISCYVAAVLIIGVLAGRRQSSLEEFLMGGHRQPWIIVMLSILATELSALTFISVPGQAFRGDWSYLQLYPGALVGKCLIAWLLIPLFYAARVMTVYEFLAQQFGPWTRSVAAVFFMASRVVGSALRLLVASIAISVVFDWPLLPVILAGAAVAVAYTCMGGIKAVIWTDALQAGVFLAAAIAVVVFLSHETNEPLAQQIATAQNAGKLRVFHLDGGLNDPTAFLPLFVYSLLLNAAVFGTDQDMTQRMLTCSGFRQGRRSLMVNALIGAPVVVLFLFVGSLIWRYYTVHPDRLPSPMPSPDHVLPLLVRLETTSVVGIKGIFLCGLFAAAMSSLDSALSALSSSAVVDFYRPHIAPQKSDRHYVRVGRAFIVGYGVLLAAVALAFSSSTDLLWRAFEWAGLIFGPLLGAFLLAALSKSRGSDRSTTLAMLAALALVVLIKNVQDIEAPWIAWPWLIAVATAATILIGASAPRRPTHRSPP